MRGVQQVNEITVANLPDPVPAPDQYLISIKACAANFFDLLQLRGKYQTQPPFPRIGGFEFSGTVLSSPRIGTCRFKKGDKVFGAAQGAYATVICANDSELQPVPEGWSFEDAAGLYLTGPTSYAALVLRARVQKGDWVLVHGAAGRIGLSAIQIAKALGARLIATTTGEENVSVCKSFGAEAVIDYIATPNFEVEVQRITSGHGADVVLDPVGLISQSLKCAAWCARLVTIGSAGGKIESIAVNRVLLKNVSIVGVHWGAYVKNDSDMIPKVWDGLFEIIEAKGFRGTTYQPKKKYRGLEDVKRALEGLERKEIWGKAVVTVYEGEKGLL